MNRAIIFDFDGTIVDSLPAVIEVFETLTKRPRRFSAREVEQLREQSMLELMVALKVPRWKVPLLLFRGRRMIRAHMHTIVVHDGMRETIQALHMSGKTLYVLSSNSTENVRDYLKRHRLMEYFSGVYGGASLMGKAPRLLKLMEKEQIDPQRSWYVGDETRDVSAARSIELNAASVTWGYNSKQALAAKDPDLLVDTPKKLLKGIEAQWKK